MQEEAVPMSEEETSDSEVIMVDPNQPYSKPAHGRTVERNLRNQVGLIDTQLKALGLYEEGLSIEQKEELLAVVAASRETAQQEESMRLQAKEWQQKVYSDGIDVELHGTTNKSQKITSSFVDASTSANTEASVQLLNSEQCAETCSSQNLFEMSEREMSTTNPSSESPSTAQHNIELSAAGRQTEPKNKRYLGRRGRGRRSISEYPAIQIATSCQQPVCQSFEAYDFKRDVLQVDFRRQKKELEKSIPEWQPCASPEAPPMDPDRFFPENERVPFYYGTECAGNLLHSIEEFHVAINKFQRNSGVYIPWGQPVTVGRAYATRSTRNKGPESENNDGIYSFHSSNISDELRSSEGSTCESYLRLRQMSNKSSQINSSAPYTTDTSKDNKDLFQPINKSCPSAASQTNTNSSLKRARILNKKTKVQNMNVNCNSDPHKENVSNNQSSGAITDYNHTEVLTTGQQEHSLTLANHTMYNHSSSSENCLHSSHMSDNKIKLPLHSDGQRNISPNLLASPQNCVTMSSRKSEIVQSIGNQHLPLKVLENELESQWYEENCIDVVEHCSTKRKMLPASVKNFNSPSKRLKGTGTA